MKKCFLEAVIFDLDGVITRTANLHAESWKKTFDEYLRLREKRDGEPFREFTHEGDYLPYVDGKPRYEGVRSFLESRGIHIPYGDPGDSPDKETICGLGNKKNKKFVQLLKEKGAEVFPSTINFIRDLHKRGIKTGVASSSKNCQTILQSVGIEDLFQTRVDGIVSAELGLKGKPEGDIFVTAAYNLGTLPSKAVVVEDATSGVMAGRNGGFGLVLGIARAGNRDDLFKNGADMVVEDMAEITVEEVDAWFQKRPRNLFQLWENSDNALDIDGKLVKREVSSKVNPVYFRKAKEAFFSQKKPVFFLDYDGTLTPIVARPDLAVLSQEMREMLKSLSERYTLAIVSGRSREDVENLVKIEGIFYAGNHGFDIKGPEVSLIQPEAEKVIPRIQEITEHFKKALSGIEGLLLEEKKFSLAIHYRLVDESKYLSQIESEVKRIVDEESSLRLMQGKKVFEVLPAIDWNKGKAIRWIMQALNLSFETHSVIYIGDDTTDEDAFRVVRTRGTGILVSQELKMSTADFWLQSPDEVKKLFTSILNTNL